MYNFSPNLLYKTEKYYTISKKMLNAMNLTV